ncbi:MAG: hypothetical protein BA863_15325 [Desulfovibrio sp. S3730MH75]|nr:MAG: hypothetical protein BA863_15325 [Desulfovibrio sp. S3730MH75]
MHFDLHLRSQITQELEKLADRMKSWEDQPRIDQDESARIRENISFFEHSRRNESLSIAGVDGSGDFPAVSYGDSFIYVTVAQGAVFDADDISGLRERGPAKEPLFHFTWLAEKESHRKVSFDEALSHFSGQPIAEVIRKSDYRHIKAKESGRNSPVEVLVDGLLRPHASDSGNVGIQLRSSAELGMALKLIRQSDPGGYVLFDSTLSLPLVTRADVSLYFEHLKRLCCVEARDKGVRFVAFSKSHGLPAIEVLEEIAREEKGLAKGSVAEHWFLRLPVPGIDNWTFSLANERRLPPAGVMTYLVRFHRNTPVYRVDLDLEYWKSSVRGSSPVETLQNEQNLFEDLDYASHDQRCYGYPYPIKAGHDRASLTKPERVALRKQIIEMAVKAGMKRTLFQDASLATGHR